MSSDQYICFGSLLRAILDRRAPMPDAASSLLDRSLIQLLDSDMIIDWPVAARPMMEAGGGRPASLPSDAHLKTLIAEAENGFGKIAWNFFETIGSGFVLFSGDQEQIETARGWAQAGLKGTFCMSDRGGPLPTNWFTTWSGEAGAPLKVDKIWAMQAAAADYGVVITHRKTALAPVPLLIDPETWATLRRTPRGKSFLDDGLQLGDVSGVIANPSPKWALIKGGPAAAKTFLTLARPRMVRALCFHARWLERLGRLQLEKRHEEILSYLLHLTEKLIDRPVFDRHSEDDVMAMKLFANSFWLDLVISGVASRVSDQRDLLAFTKIEGSSYRCLLEIAQRNRAVAHAAA